MDASNEHLSHLIKQTDHAFKALMQEPGSRELNQAYDKAKLELDSYVSSLRNTLNQRHSRSLG